MNKKKINNKEWEYPMRNGKCSRKENSKQRREAGGGIEERPGD